MTTRILHIIPTLDRGGAEKQLSLLATGLPRDEFDVHLCALTRGGPLLEKIESAGIPVEIIDKRWKVDPAAYWRLRRYIQKLKPDIVQTWLFAANSYGRKAALAANVPHIIGGERCVDSWKVWHELAIDRYLARRSERIIVNSSGVLDFYVGHGLAEEKFTIIPNGIEPFTDAHNRSREKILTDLGLPGDTKMIAAVGRLWPQKRLKDLIWAAELLGVIRDDVHFLIIGEGPQRNILQRFRDQMSNHERIHFLGHRNDVESMLPHFDCLWLGSGYEGLPNSVMEAMSAGVPVVASDIPGNRDLVIPEKTGYLVSVGDRASFARWTKLILEDADLAARLGKAARERMRSAFSVEQMIQRHAKLYRELIG